MRGNSEILTTHEAARLLRVTPMTVIRWIDKGLLPAFKTAGGHRRMHRADFERFCEQRKMPNSDERELAEYLQESAIAWSFTVEHGVVLFPVRLEEGDDELYRFSSGQENFTPPFMQHEYESPENALRALLEWQAEQARA